MSGRRTQARVRGEVRANTVNPLEQAAFPGEMAAAIALDLRKDSQEWAVLRAREAQNSSVSIAGGVGHSHSQLPSAFVAPSVGVDANTSPNPIRSQAHVQGQS